MEEYIQEALNQGFIRPSTSPAASSFFFVGKKDRGLRPCIDYRVLNSQMVKLPYPLPLVPAALEELRGARIFSKLDLRSVYNHRHHVTQVLQRLRQHHLYLKLEKCEFHRPTVQFLDYIIGQEGIQMDQGKVTAVKEWPLPLSVKELQRFLGFANFYHRFIKDFSLHTAPLTSMLRGKPKSLSWDSNAHEAFEGIKSAFSTAPHSSPSRSPHSVRG